MVKLLKSVAAAAGYRIPSNLTRALKSHSPELIDLSDDFRTLERVQMIPIFTCFESLATYKNMVIVLSVSSGC